VIETSPVEPDVKGPHPGAKRKHACVSRCLRDPVSGAVAWRTPEVGLQQAALDVLAVHEHENLYDRMS
jgi:hypothetical protein